MVNTGALLIYSGVEQWLARQAHNLEVAGSNPAHRNQKNILTNQQKFDIIEKKIGHRKFLEVCELLEFAPLLIRSYYTFRPIYYNGHRDFLFNANE